MEREIKFRAWVKFNYGPGGSHHKMMYQGTPDLETLQSFMFHYGSEKNLMQFTGLKDKLGNDVYEKDYLVNNNGSNFIINFIEGCFCLQNVANGNRYPLSKANLENKRVISNKFEYSKHKADNGCH